MTAAVVQAFPELPDRNVGRLQFRRLLEMVRDPKSVPVEDWDVPEDTHLLKSPQAFHDQVIDALMETKCQGETMPAVKTHGLLQFRQHEVTVWYGYKASYKSVFLNELFTSWACRGIAVAIGSFEMPGYKVAALAVRQALAMGERTPPVAEIERALEHLSESLVIYDVMGKVKPRHMLAVMRYCAIELGCRHFLLDNLTTLLPVGNDHADLHQGFFTGVLTIARMTGMHIHVVAHCSKPEKGDTSKIPTGYQIRGIGAVPDTADNLVAVWRNTPKEDKIEADKATEDVRREPDLILLVDKQKFWDYRGMLKFWIDRRALRFQEGGLMETQAFV